MNDIVSEFRTAAVFFGSGNNTLAAGQAFAGKHNITHIISRDLGKFSNGEVKLEINDNIRGSNITYFAPANAGWACQAGVTADPNKIAGYRPNLTEAEPVFDGNTVRTKTGAAFTLVHQYDRVPAWRDALLKKYGS